MMNTGSSRWIAYASSVMPPPTERNQKGRGTTLSFARSDATHWTRKRAEKNAWPSRPMPSHTCSVVIVTTPREVPTLGRAPKHRAQDVVRLADLVGAPAGGDEREDLLGLLAGHRGGLVPDVGEVAERDLEGGGDVVEAVERDRLLTPFDLADELSAETGALPESLLAERSLLPEGAQALSQELPDVLHGAFGHGYESPTLVILLTLRNPGVRASVEIPQTGSVPPVMIARTRAPSGLHTRWTQPGGRRA